MKALQISLIRRALALLAVVGLTLPLAAGSAEAATSKQLLDCQKAIETQMRSLTHFTTNRVQGCVKRVDTCKLANEIDAADLPSCIAAASPKCASEPTKVADKQIKAEQKAVLKCGLIPMVEIEQFVAGLGFFNVSAGCGASDVNTLLSCLFTQGRCSGERRAFILDPRAQDSLTEVGIAASFPCVAP